MKKKKKGCNDCGRPYGDEHGFPDLMISNKIWEQISPTGDGGGLLCPSCMCKRLYLSGFRDVMGAFLSGPIKSAKAEDVEWMLRHQKLKDER